METFWKAQESAEKYPEATEARHGGICLQRQVFEDGDRWLKVQGQPGQVRHKSLGLHFFSNATT